MSLEFHVPTVHAVDLVLVVSLAGALGDVSLGPLAVSGSDLLDTLSWVLTVVSVNIVKLTSLTLGTAMGHLVLVVKAASLVATVEVALHTIGVVGELLDPCVL